MNGKINTLIVGGITLITGSLILKSTTIKDEQIKMRFVLKRLELLSMLIWPVVFDKIVGYKKLKENRLLFIPFAIPLLKSIDNYRKISTLNLDDEEEADKHLNDIETLKLSTVTNQIVTFAYFINLIASKCHRKKENIFNPILITYVIGSLTEFMSNLSVFSQVNKIYINMVKKMISIYCTCIILVIAISNVYSKEEDDDGNNTK